jgi:hypothetical protein
VLPRVSLRGTDVPIALAHPREQLPVPPERPSRKFFKPSNKGGPQAKRRRPPHKGTAFKHHKKKPRD